MYTCMYACMWSIYIYVMYVHVNKVCMSCMLMGWKWEHMWKEDSNSYLRAACRHLSRSLSWCCAHGSCFLSGGCVASSHNLTPLKCWIHCSFSIHIIQILVLDRNLSLSLSLSLSHSCFFVVFVCYSLLDIQCQFFWGEAFMKTPHMHAHIHTHACIHSFICIHECMHTCMHRHMHAHTHIHTHTHTQMHTHTYTQVHRRNVMGSEKIR